MTVTAFRVAGLVLATAILHLVLIQPNHPDAMTWEALLLFPLELPFIIALLLALPARHPLTTLVRVVLVAVLVTVAVLKAADFALFTAFNRSFNPLVDIHLIEAGLRLLSGTLGLVPAILIAIVGVCIPPLLMVILWWATGRWAALALPKPLPAIAAVLAVIAGGVVVAEVGQVRRAWSLPFDPPGSAFTARVALERTTAYRALFADLEEFRLAAAEDPIGDASALFDRLEGADVLIVFLESYGRTSFDNPLYAPTHTARLETEQQKLAAAGLAMASGWLTSPIAGGQSWLAHGTFASGLRTGNQARYSAMLASPRRTLFDLATEAGYHTSAVMPAITLPWPEADLLGFETVYPAAGLGYEGLPFNWVTMPDQFTLTAFDRLLPDSPTPEFTQIALISSHAPWTPVPEMLDWADIGDGTEFNDFATSGDPPSVVWADRDRIRDQYRLSIDYTLQAIMDHTARSADRDRLTILLGDHPPAASVSQIDSRDVPVHIIGSPDLLAAIAEWGYTPGLIPDSDAPVWPMEAFRDRLVAAYTTNFVIETE